MREEKGHPKSLTLNLGPRRSELSQWLGELPSHRPLNCYFHWPLKGTSFPSHCAVPAKPHPSALPLTPATQVFSLLGLFRPLPQICCWSRPWPMEEKKGPSFCRLSNVRVGRYLKSLLSGQYNTFANTKICGNTIIKFLLIIYIFQCDSKEIFVLICISFIIRKVEHLGAGKFFLGMTGNSEVINKNSDKCNFCELLTYAPCLFFKLCYFPFSLTWSIFIFRDIIPLPYVLQIFFPTFVIFLSSVLRHAKYRIKID